MTQSRTYRAKIAASLAVALAGGTVMSTCQTRIKDGVIDGSKDFLFTQFNPAVDGTFANQLFAGLMPDDQANE